MEARVRESRATDAAWAQNITSAACSTTHEGNEARSNQTCEICYERRACACQGGQSVCSDHEQEITVEAATDGQIAEAKAKTSCTAAKMISPPCKFLARKRGDPLRCAFQFDSPDSTLEDPRENRGMTARPRKSMKHSPRTAAGQGAGISGESVMRDLIINGSAAQEEKKEWRAKGKRSASRTTLPGHQAPTSSEYRTRLWFGELVVLLSPFSIVCHQV